MVKIVNLPFVLGFIAIAHAELHPKHFHLKFILSCV